MSATLYREFTLSSPQVWQAVVAFVKSNAKSAVEADAPLRLILTTAERKRHDDQNRHYFGTVLRDISEQAWVCGRQSDKEVWHEYLADKFAPKVEFRHPLTGELRLRRKSTADMGVKEFAEYVRQVQAYAAMELGVVFED